MSVEAKTAPMNLPSFARTGRDWVAVEVRSALAKDGKFIGAVFASTDMKYFQELFRSTSTGDGYAITLLRKDGTLLTRHPMAGQIGTKVSASILSSLSESRSGVSRSTSPVDGESRIAAA